MKLDHRVVSFRQRAPALEPMLVVAHGDVMPRLAKRILDNSDDELARLRACTVDADWLFVSAEAEALPWVDGVAYLGQEPELPGLFVRTHRAPSVPSSLLPALIQRVTGLALPIALVDETDQLRIFDLSGLGAIDRAVLARFVRGVAP